MPAARKDYANNPIIPRLWLTGDNVREETIQHHLNRYSMASQYVQLGASVVDICCGTGYGTAILKAGGAGEAVGVDLSREAIEAADAQYPGCIFVCESATDFLQARSQTGHRRLEVVTFFEAIEHLPRPDGHKILDSVQGSLATKGHFFMSTPRDIRADVNPDHITQWEFNELQDELGSRFAEVDLFGQDWATGEFSSINPEEASFFVARCSQPIEVKHEK